MRWRVLEVLMSEDFRRVLMPGTVDDTDAHVQPFLGALLRAHITGAAHPEGATPDLPVFDTTGITPDPLEPGGTVAHDLQTRDSREAEERRVALLTGDKPLPPAEVQAVHTPPPTRRTRSSA